MVKGYIGIDTFPSKYDTVLSQLEKLPEIKEIHKLSHIDPDVFLETKEMYDRYAVEDFVREQIRSLDGIIGTQTYITGVFDKNGCIVCPD